MFATPWVVTPLMTGLSPARINALVMAHLQKDIFINQFAPQATCGGNVSDLANIPVFINDLNINSFNTQISTTP
jgi:hypothetical protein